MWKIIIWPRAFSNISQHSTHPIVTYRLFYINSTEKLLNIHLVLLCVLTECEHRLCSIDLKRHNVIHPKKKKKKYSTPSALKRIDRRKKFLDYYWMYYYYVANVFVVFWNWKYSVFFRPTMRNYTAVFFFFSIIIIIINNLPLIIL